MLNLKKTAAAVLALGGSAVFAGTMGPACTAGSVTVPCERTAWDFGVQALYLQASGAPYANATTSVAGVTTFEEFDDKWGWGFRLEGSYHFNTGNDINVNWYHFSKNTTRTFADSDIFGGPFTLSAKPKWDAVNAEFGQWVDFGDQKNIRFHGGVQFVRIERNHNISTAGLTGNITHEYKGVGPRLGMDMSYELGNGFGFYGNGATAILAGENKFNASLAGLSFSANSPDRTRIVPEIEAKLGINYTYLTGQNDVNIELGYMFVNYFDALHNPLTININHDTNFALHGPYIGAKWIGNIV